MKFMLHINYMELSDYILKVVFMCYLHSVLHILYGHETKSWLYFCDIFRMIISTFVNLQIVTLQ